LISFNIEGVAKWKDLSVEQKVDETEALAIWEKKGAAKLKTL
tara:strand:- start:1829 stop:1954 length:126 start_codon:yes stop_codon:yes gene_type:complete